MSNHTRSSRDVQAGPPQTGRKRTCAVWSCQAGADDTLPRFDLPEGLCSRHLLFRCLFYTGLDTQAALHLLPYTQAELDALGLGQRVERCTCNVRGCNRPSFEASLCREHYEVLTDIEAWDAASPQELHRLLDEREGIRRCLRGQTVPIDCTPAEYPPWDRYLWTRSREQMGDVAALYVRDAPASLIGSLADSYSRRFPGLDRAMLLSAGQEAVLRAIEGYDGMGSPFRPYARKCVARAMWKLKPRPDGQGGRTSTRVYDDRSDSSSRRPSGTGPDPHSRPRPLDPEDSAAVLSRLPKEDRPIASMVLQGWTSKQIGRRLDLSDGTVRNRWGPIKKRIRRIIDPGGTPATPHRQRKGHRPAPLQSLPPQVQDDVLSRLPFDLAVVAMEYFQGRTSGEIGDRLGMDPRTVRNKKRRIRSLLAAIADAEDSS